MKRPFGFPPHLSRLKKDTDDIADAVLKVCANIEELRGLKHEAIEVKSMGRAERPRIEKRQW